MFFLLLHKNLRCGYSLEVPHWGISNEYPHHIFAWRNKKNINDFWFKKWLVCENISQWCLLVFFISYAKSWYFIFCDEPRPTKMCLQTYMGNEGLDALAQASLGLCCQHIPWKHILAWYNSNTSFEINLYHSMRKSADDKLIFFLFLPENRLWHVMQIVTFASLSSMKKKKNILNFHLMI